MPNGENYYWNCGATDPIQPTCRYKVKPVGVMVAPGVQDYSSRGRASTPGIIPKK